MTSILQKIFGDDVVKKTWGTNNDITNEDDASQVMPDAILNGFEAYPVQNGKRIIPQGALASIFFAIAKNLNILQTKTITATQTEYFNRNNTQPITAENIYQDVRLARFAVINSTNGLTQTLAIGGSYNLLTSLLEANETQQSSIAIQYKNTLNAVQATLLNQTTDRFLMPSSLYTFNSNYIKYTFRVQVTYNVPATTQTIVFYIRLRRGSDNSVIPGGELRFVIHNTNAKTGEIICGSLETSVNSEIDPFVVNGCYLSIENDASSANSLTITGTHITIFCNT